MPPNPILIIKARIVIYTCSWQGPGSQGPCLWLSPFPCSALVARFYVACIYPEIQIYMRVYGLVLWGNPKLLNNLQTFYRVLGFGVAWYGMDTCSSAIYLPKRPDKHRMGFETGFQCRSRMPRRFLHKGLIGFLWC